MEGQTSFHLGSGAQAPDVRLAAPQAAALVGAEGENGLPREVEALQEGENAHGHGAPVIGVTTVAKGQLIWYTLIIGGIPYDGCDLCQTERRKERQC